MKKAPTVTNQGPSSQDHITRSAARAPILSARCIGLARALLDGPVTREEAYQIAPAPNLTLLQERLRLTLPCERVRFVTVGGLRAWYERYLTTPKDREALALYLEDIDFRGGTGMSIETILARLDRVTQKTEIEYRASCPTGAHKYGDRSAGLCITASADGKTLLYCPAGCNADEITAAVGLELRDLFPRDQHYQSPTRRDGLSASERRERRKLYEQESFIVRFAKAVMADGEILGPEDALRVLKADDRARLLRGELYGVV